MSLSKKAQALVHASSDNAFNNKVVVDPGPGVRVLQVGTHRFTIRPTERTEWDNPHRFPWGPAENPNSPPPISSNLVKV